MSIETAQASTGAWDLRTVRVLRLALFTTLAMAVAQLGNWPLSFIAPVLVAALFEMPVSAPTLGEFARDLLATIASVGAICVFIVLLQPYPLVFLVAYAMVIFWLAYLMNKGAPPIPPLMSLVALLVLPHVGVVDDSLTFTLGGCLLISMLLGLLTVQLGFGLMPDPPGEQATVPAFQRGYQSSAARAALATTLVVTPAMAMFLTFGLTAQLLVMVYLGVMAWAGNLGHAVYDARKYLTANAIGGAVALLCYWLLVAVPEIHFLLPLILLVSLLFGAYRFSARPGAAYFGSALIGVIILISSTLSPAKDIEVNILLRVLYIFLAGLYAMGVTSIVAPRINPDGDAHGH